MGSWRRSRGGPRDAAADWQARREAGAPLLPAIAGARCRPRVRLD
jgi:hypothetical protein